MRNRTGCLYRHFDKSGALLYVGSCANPLARLKNHKQNSKWFHQIVRVEIEHFTTRVESYSAERTAIATEQPIYNIFRAEVNSRPVVQINEGVTRRSEARIKNVECALKLQSKRLATGLKASWVATEMGVSPNYLSFLETGRRNWTPALEQKFLKAIGETTKPKP